MGEKQFGGKYEGEIKTYNAAEGFWISFELARRAACCQCKKKDDLEVWSIGRRVADLRRVLLPPLATQDI